MSTSRSHPRVLVATPSQFVGEHIQRVLEDNANCLVAVVRRGVSARKNLHDGDWDVAILDCDMVHPSGTDLCQELSDALGTNLVDFVLLSSLEGDSLRALQSMSGVSGVISKATFTNEHILGVVHSVVA